MENTDVFEEEELDSTSIDPETGFAISQRGSMTRAQAAGDGFGYPWGIWASYSNTDVSNNFAATSFDADTDTVTFGVDFSPWDNTLAGVAIGYSDTSLDSFFNAGRRDSDGFSIVPYFGWIIDDVGIDVDLSADVALGFTRMDITQFRTLGAARVTSETDQDTVFISTNINASKDVGGVRLGGRMGLLYGQSTTNGFTESNGTVTNKSCFLDTAVSTTNGFTESNGTVVADNRVTTGLLTLEANMAYFWGNFEPFASVTYEIDVSRDDVIVVGAVQPANDTNDVLVSAGLNWYSDNDIVAGIRYEKSLDRTQFEADTISIQIRADF